VLPVVDELARFAIAKRGRASAELRSCVDDKDPPSLVRERGRRAEAGKSSAYHDDRV
jgi:hypothetical protein